MVPGGLAAVRIQVITHLTGNNIRGRGVFPRFFSRIHQPGDSQNRPVPSTQYRLIRKAKTAIRGVQREGSIEEAALFWLIANKGKYKASTMHSIDLKLSSSRIASPSLNRLSLDVSCIFAIIQFMPAMSRPNNLGERAHAK